MEKAPVQSATPLVRLLYCLAVAGALYSSASALWTAFANMSGFDYSLGLLGVLWTIALALWRLWQVASSSTRLDAPEYRGAIADLRVLGIIGLAVGAVSLVLNLLIQPLLHALFSHGSENGGLHFIAGQYMYLVKSLAPPGILMFELSRLMAFERRLREQS